VGDFVLWLVFLIALGLGLGMWAAAIAGTKQRSMAFYGWLGFSFGLIGVFIAFAMPDARPTKRLNARA
jgi:hypothetical protein